MLTANDRILIAASVDGSLDPRQHERLHLLLKQSSDARRLQRALRRERSKIAELPQHSAPASVLPAVMARIAEVEPWSTLPSVSRVPQKRRLLPFAVAASVAMLAGLGVWYGVQANQHRGLAQAQVQSLPHVEPTEPMILDVSPEVVSRIPLFDYPDDVVVVDPEVAPVPRVAPDRPREVYGAPFIPLPKLDAVQVKLPLLAEFQDLNRDEVKKRLTLELSKSPTVRVDLFSRDPLKAAELLIATGRATGVHVIIDRVAQERLRRRIPTTWLLYSESLTPEEITTWLLRLAAADAKPATANPTQTVYQSLHIPGTSSHDAKDLKDLLGIEQRKLKTTKANPAKPLSDGTLAEISSSLQKDKSAILVSYLPQKSRVNPNYSRDIKAWLDRRGDRKPGTVALEVILH